MFFNTRFCPIQQPTFTKTHPIFSKQNKALQIFFLIFLNQVAIFWRENSNKAFLCDFEWL